MSVIQRAKMSTDKALVKDVLNVSATKQQQQQQTLNKNENEIKL